MGRRLTIVSTAVVTAILTSAFWIFAYNIAIAPTDGRVKSAGDVKTVDGGNVAIAEGVEVGPAGLAIPVIGVKSKQLTDTFLAAMKTPEVQPKLAQLGLFAVNSCGTAFGDFLRNIVADYERIIQQAGIKAN